MLHYIIRSYYIRVCYASPHSELAKDGGLQFLVAASRANVGVKSGRHPGIAWFGARNYVFVVIWYEYKLYPITGTASYQGWT